MLLCDLIESEKEEDACSNNVAVSTNDIAICAQIKNPEDKSECERSTEFITI